MINIIPSVWLYTIPFFAIAGGSPNSQDMITTNVLKSPFLSPVQEK
jgi:hypothetical protein